MKKMFFLAFMAFMSSMALAADNYSVIFKAQGNYEDVRDMVQASIESKGLKINSVNHIADMLARTGKDLGATRQVYEGGEQFEFCSARISRDMMEADPHALDMCPYIISVYTVPGDKTVYVAYRKPVQAKNPKLKKALGEVEKLLTEIIKEAIQ
jgi:uncharacterized protein (DUF302 family)